MDIGVLDPKEAKWELAILEAMKDTAKKGVKGRLHQRQHHRHTSR